MNSGTSRPPVVAKTGGYPVWLPSLRFFKFSECSQSGVVSLRGSTAN